MEGDGGGEEGEEEGKGGGYYQRGFLKFDFWSFWNLKKNLDFFSEFLVIFGDFSPIFVKICYFLPIKYVIYMFQKHSDATSVF